MPTMIEKRLEAAKKELAKANGAVERAAKKVAKMKAPAETLGVIMGGAEFEARRHELSGMEKDAYWGWKWASDDLCEQVDRRTKAKKALDAAQARFDEAAPAMEAKARERRELERYTGENYFAETKKVFEEILAGMKAEAEARRLAYYNRVRDNIAAYIKLGETTKKDLEANGPYPYKRGQGYTETHKLVDSLAREYRPDGIYSEYYGANAYPQARDLIDLRTDVDGIIARKVARDVEEMFASFIYKQTYKTGAIVKGRRPTVKGNVTPGSLECYLTFDLEDGAHFEMKCQIVWHENDRGTQYYQFPTTFHNARKADGTKIGTPSEIKLKKEL